MIINLGDSIFGYNDGVTSLSNKIANKTGKTVINCGFGGTRAVARGTTDYHYFDMATLVDAIISGDYSAQDTSASVSAKFPIMLDRLKSITFSNQIVTLNHGTNDWSANIKIDVYKTNLKTIINKLKTAYPNIKIVLISPAWRCEFDSNKNVVDGSWSKTNGNGNTVLDFVNAMQEVATECNVGFINCYDIDINESNCNENFTAPDGTHQNMNGRELLATQIAKELEKIMK